ncbi:protein-disulfide reductase DsbD domain-containing protein [Allorhizobium undicola]|uniref:protein-disulfide reductase DsbD domain-containing protein n=1 Tax=Allorhizobium undicola TaxID=78527 RepID=UPI001AEC22B2|nr:protein-disulfide reductase DsbD domain-containing protein [Allorhizobium undicola]
MRLIVLAANADGTRQAALQIEPNSGWFTYWREPGDAGIPPSLTQPAGQSASLSELSFPVPKRMEIGTVRDVGYDMPVTLPFTIKPESGLANFTATVFIGMCRNICIPFQAELTVALSEKEVRDPSEIKAVEKAMARLPAAPSEDFRVTGFRMAGDLSSLDVNLTVPAGSKQQPRILLTGPEGHLFMDYQRLDGDDRHMSLRIALGKLPRNYAPWGKTWRLLVLAGNHRAMEAPLVFDPAPPIVQP